MGVVVDDCMCCWSLSSTAGVVYTYRSCLSLMMGMVVKEELWSEIDVPGARL